jgi:phospholipid/cholesterol/gamma-HCH transport system permease protein
MSFSRPDVDTLVIRLAGNWKLERRLPSVVEVQRQIDAVPKVQRLAFDTRQLTAWDSGLLTFLIKVGNHCIHSNVAMMKEGLPQGVSRLLSLATAVPEKKDARRKAERVPLLARIGTRAIDLQRSAMDIVGFVGEATLAFIRFLLNKARFRRSDLILFIEDCGAKALGIVSLISVLVGLILAFVGAVQLKMFGAQIYVANLVGIAMTREMGAMMSAIIMAGRTGAAFAAQLGTMEVNEEIDALKTLGVSPMEFLVLPRMLALILMMPLLCLYADFMGILGGLIVGVGMLDISFMEYFNQTREAVPIKDFAIGVIKSVVFGVIIALSGCLRGMQCGRSASAVGVAATSAVVTAIVLIIVSDALMTIMCNVLGV